MSQNKERNIKSTQNFTKNTKRSSNGPQIEYFDNFDSKMSKIVEKNEITNQNFT